MRPLRVYLLALLLLAGIWLSGTSVSDSFRDCRQFFYMRAAPTGIDGTRDSLKRICQRYGDKARYATLYDGSRRLPLYSAYTFKKNDGKKRMDTPWMYEPQLVSGNEGGNMKVLPPSDDPEPLIQESQAVLEDYSDAVEYSRGLLNPDQHQADPDDKASTYTLTNVVPQPHKPSGAVNSSVDSSFRECSQFLYRGLAPRGLQGTRGLQKVCQHYGDKARYATLYDPAGRIPLFSAYTFKRSNGESREGLPWMYEPQLSLGSGTGNMQPFPGSPSSLLALEESQAVLADYSDAVVYERGQLNPDQLQASPGDKASTYTLTNVVPQAKEFLQHHWLSYLEGIRKRLNNYCRGTAYIISGVTTTGNTIRRGNVNRVRVPKHLWTAYCCPDFDLGAPYELRYKFPTYAAYGLNDVVDNAVTETSTKSVEALVNREMAVDQDFQLFNGNCVPEV